MMDLSSKVQTNMIKFKSNAPIFPKCSWSVQMGLRLTFIQFVKNATHIVSPCCKATQPSQTRNTCPLAPQRGSTWNLLEVKYSHQLATIMEDTIISRVQSTCALMQCKIFHLFKQNSKNIFNVNSSNIHLSIKDDFIQISINWFEIIQKVIPTCITHISKYTRFYFQIFNHHK